MKRTSLCEMRESVARVTRTVVVRSERMLLAASEVELQIPTRVNGR